jgi:hypothetical protein
MPGTAIEAIHWNPIVGAISDHNCVPFLGAGVNASGFGYLGLPVGSQVAMRLARELTDFDEQVLERVSQKALHEILIGLVQVKKRLSDSELQQLAEAEIQKHISELGSWCDLLQVALSDLARVALRIEVQAGHNYLMKCLRKILPDDQHQPSPLLKTLAALPFKLIITTNFDRLMERALGKRPYELVVQPITGFPEQNQEELQKRLSNPRGVIVYKIHGTFHDNAQLSGDRPIITEEDYIEFLTVVTRENAGVPALISEKLRGSTILFLGYSLQDWDFRMIYKSLIEPIPKRFRPESFAIQKNPPDYLKLYWKEKGITILDVDMFEFAAGLDQRCTNLLTREED